MLGGYNVKTICLYAAVEVTGGMGSPAKLRLREVGDLEINLAKVPVQVVR